MNENEKQELLKLARKTIGYCLEKRTTPDIRQLDIEPTDAMKQKRAVFVTLKKDHDLRGCIGDIIPRGALYESVIRNAVNAAFNDWRFRPVTKGEADSLTIEISALTVPAPVTSAKEIRIGTDGIILEKSGASAVFLPQVAPEQGWGLEETLTHLSLKAGLDADAWKHGAKFQVFQAEVFGEDESVKE